MGLVLAALALLASPGQAFSETRSGFWFGAGGGYGGATASSDGGTGEMKSSGLGYFEGGYTVTERLLVGGEFGLWSKKYPYPTPGDYSRVHMYSLTGTAKYYPQRAGGLFVKGGAGMAFIDSRVRALGLAIDSDLGRGLGLIGGAGYDIAIGAVAISPAVAYWYGWLGDLKAGGETFATNHRQSVVALTVGITIP